MRDRRHANLLFLLGAAPLACAAGDIGVDPGPLSAASFGSNSATDGGDGPDATESGTDGGSGAADGANDSNDDGPDDGVDDAVDTGDDGPVDEGPPGDIGDESSDGPLDDSATDDSSAEGPPETSGGYSGDACADYGVTLADCAGGGDATYYEYYCNDVIDYYYASYGPACAAAVEELFACIATLDCASISAGAGCDAESAAFTAAC